MRAARLLLVAASLAGLPAALFFLGRAAPSEVPTIEQLLPPAEVAEIARIRGIFETEPDVVLVGVRPATPARLEAFASKIRGVEGVARAWTGRLPVVVVALEPGALGLTRARALTQSLDAAVARVRAPGERTHVVGTPHLRVASWEVAARDLRTTLPLLVVVAVAVPLLFFGAPAAVFFPLLLAALTTALCLVGYRLAVGPLNAMVLLLVPLIWSVATLDALHLYHRARATGSIATARRQLRAPCLVTTLTTAGGLAALALHGGAPLLRTFGVWAALGTLLAYALTFTAGGALLEFARGQGRPPRWPARAAARLARCSARRPRTVRAVWALILGGAALLAGRLELSTRFPRYFAASQPVTREMEAMEALLGTDLSPLEIYVEPTDDDGRRPAALASAMLAVSSYLRTLPEQRVVFPYEFLDPDELRGARSGHPDQAEARLVELAADERLAPWVRLDAAAARIQAHFAPISFGRRGEIVEWLRHFDRTMLSHHRLSFGGPGYLYLVAERRGRDAAVAGGLLSLLVVGVALAACFRRPRLLLAALAGNLVPVVCIAGLMGALEIPWSLAVLPLPAILLGLAVDDTVHLLWPLRRGGGSARRAQGGAARAGPPLLATTAVLAGCIATMTLSGLQINRELGLLLPAGLVLALSCDLTLLPALAVRAGSRRR